MPIIPKNNLKERMLKLGYDPKFVHITPPVIDNSKVVRKNEAPIEKKPQITHQAPLINFTPPVIVNIDEWSDFEDD